VADKASREMRDETRRAQLRFHTQRQEAIAASRQRAAEMRHDGKLDSLVAQRQRHAHSVALENVAYLRHQVTFRKPHATIYNMMPEQVAQ